MKRIAKAALRQVGLLLPPARPGIAWLSVVARIPTFLMSLALVLFVRETGGTFAWAGTVSFSYVLGVTIAGPLVASSVAHFGPRYPMIITGVTFGLTTWLLVSSTSTETVGQMIAAIVVGTSLPPTIAVMRSGWASFRLNPSALQHAYVWEATVSEVLAIVSPALLGLLMFIGSAGQALTLTALVGGAAAIAVGILSPSVSQDTFKTEKTGLALLAPLTSWKFVSLLVTMAMSASALGFTLIGITFFTESEGAIDSTGVIYSAWGLGSIVGILLFGKSRTLARPSAYPILLLAFAAGVALPALASTSAKLVLLLVFSGLPLALISAAELSLVQLTSPGKYLPVAFTWASTAGLLGEGLGTQLAGWFAPQLSSPSLLFLFGSIVALASALVGWLLVSRLRRESDFGNDT